MRGLVVSMRVVQLKRQPEVVSGQLATIEIQIATGGDITRTFCVAWVYGQFTSTESQWPFGDLTLRWRVCVGELTDIVAFRRKLTSNKS